MLRLISAVLHERPGPTVSEAALDLRPAELGILVPLVGCLLALSAWPAAISGNTIENSSGIPALRRGDEFVRSFSRPPHFAPAYLRSNSDSVQVTIIVGREHRPKR
jgi:hypothetical protein